MNTLNVLLVIGLLLVVGGLIRLYVLNSKKENGYQTKGFAEDLAKRKDAVSSTVVMGVTLLFIIPSVNQLLPGEGAQLYISEIVSYGIAFIGLVISFIGPIFNRVTSR